MNTVEITQSDVDAIREYKRHLAKKWWKTESRDQAFCDHCQSPVPRDTGYLFGDSYLYCEHCGDEQFGQDALDNLRRSPSYFGSGVLQEARIFAANKEQDKKDSPRSAISLEEMDEVIRRVDKMSLFDTSKKITASVVIKHKVLKELTVEEKKELMGCCLVDHISHISNRYSMMTPGDAIVATRCLKCGQQYWTRVSKGGESDVNVMMDIIKYTTDQTTVMDGSETDLIADFDKTAKWNKKGSPYRNFKDTGRIEIWTKGKDNESQMTVVNEQTKVETIKTLFKRLFNRK